MKSLSLRDSVLPGPLQHLHNCQDKDTNYYLSVNECMLHTDINKWNITQALKNNCHL